MPTYEVELSDGRVVEMEGDREPTESDVMSALGGPPEPSPQPLVTKSSSIPEWIRNAAGAFAQSPIDLAEQAQKVPAKASELTEAISAPIAETGGRVLSDFLNRTGIDPSAMPERNIVDIPSIGERLGPDEMNRMPKAVQALIGVHDTAARTASGFTEPGQAAVLPFLGTKPAQALIAAQSLSTAPQVAQALSEAQTPAQVASAVTEGAINAAIGAGVGSHLLPAELRSLPKASQAALETLKERIPNASEVSQATEVHGDVRPQQIQGAGEVPAAEGSGGVQPQAQEGVSQAGQAGVLLKPESVTPPVTDKGIAASVRNKWTTATEEPFGSEAGFINLDPLKELIDKATPYVKAAYEGVKDLGKEQLKARTVDDYRRSVLNWSGKLQKSFGEAGEAQKDIQKQVPDEARREGITNWIQADGDPQVLAQRLAATTDPKLRRGYEAALNLTPEEIGVANDVKRAYSVLGQRGNNYDVLKTFKPDYVTQIWDLGKGPTAGSSRTLRDKFRFAKASTFPTFFDGEQAGYTPKTKDISKLLPVYLHEMNSVIAARQLVEQLSKGTASDGRPLVAPRGVGTQVTGPSGQATLIMPKAVKGDTLDYKTLPNQPALNDWRWASTDAAGNPVLLKGDLAIHPEVADQFKNILSKSAIREWYQSKGSVAAKVPKLIVQGLDMANSGTKRTMLGLLAPFHQVQEATHGVGHRVDPSPWSIPKIDLVNNRAQMDAANHGLMLLPDKTSADQFMEGFKVSGLVSHIPIVGKVADFYSNYLFHQYIPGLKYNTYEAILGRNNKVYAADIASGKVNPEDIKHLSAEQANAAYGHLNYTDLGRNPTVQHFLQLTMLAPDFFEARARFTAQSMKGLVAKNGREQLVALGVLAALQAATAYTAAKLSGGDWDAKHPFEFHIGGRRYSMRSVPEDISSLMNDWRQYTYSRISPIIGKGTLQYLSKVDWRGQKISAYDTTKQLLQQPIPISIRGFFGLGRNSLSGWEQLTSALGLRISRYSAVNDTLKMAEDWMKKSPDPKVQQKLAIDQASVFPDSQYKPLRLALTDNNQKAAVDAYKELLKTKTPLDIFKALSAQHPFTGSIVNDLKFKRSLTPDQLKIYNEAVAERRETLKRFIQMRKSLVKQ